MLALVYALVAAAAVGTLTALTPWFAWYAAIIPALVALVAVYFLLTRRVQAAISQQMQGLQALLMNKNIDGALALLEAMRVKYSKWIFMLSSQLDGQIGSIYYLKKDFEKARPYLEKAFVRMWDSKLMLACLLSGQVGPNKKAGDMKAVDLLLERVTKYTPKQGLLYSTWAWLHWKAGDNARAILVLAKGKEALGESDPHLTANLLALQNDKKMKMKGYGEVWYTFHLEQHPMVMQQQRGGNVRFARR
jgi:tetratricopeptide (TPR) repeat protein